MPSHKRRSTLWWKRYPDTNRHLSCEPGRDDVADPRLSVGTRVRLCGKPNKARAILKVEWHRYRYRYVYVVEASGGSVPYWFADQLMLEDEWLLTHGEPIHFAGSPSRDEYIQAMQMAMPSNTPIWKILLMSGGVSLIAGIWLLVRDSYFDGPGTAMLLFGVILLLLRRWKTKWEFLWFSALIFLIGGVMSLFQDSDVSMPGLLMLLPGIFWLWIGWSAKDMGVNWDKNSANREHFAGTISEAGIDLRNESAWRFIAWSKMTAWKVSGDMLLVFSETGLILMPASQFSPRSEWERACAYCAAKIPQMKDEKDKPVN
ncbi:MAG: hypothetical protein PHP57_05650 [Sideroxydans sp.]|nr:hypothetical protein [Sideroxydans sp.]